MLGRTISVAAVPAIAAAFTLMAGGVTHADPGQSFYDPPAQIAGAPGDVIRTMPQPIAVRPPGFDAETATRVLYVSTDVNGTKIGVSGMVFKSNQPWKGAGTRPLIGLAAGTHGQADRCAPSRMLAESIEPELSNVANLLAAGYNVAFTDYDGLGTPGVHPYLNSVDAARATIDVVRAAERMGIGSADSQVVFTGTSQGGQAAEASIEEVATYAPELVVLGAAAVIGPPDMFALLTKLDGSLLTGVIGFYLNGLIAQYPQALAPIMSGLNTAGKNLLADSVNKCAFDVANYGFQKSSSFTKSGKSVSAFLASDPVLRQLTAAQFIGNRKPAAPVLLVTSTSDDIVPSSSVDTLAADWKRLGGNVTLQTAQVPVLFPSSGLGHLGTASAAGIPVLNWMNSVWRK